MKRKYKNTRPISAFAIVSFVIFIISSATLAVAKHSFALADSLNKTVCHTFRRIMAAFGDIFPFSLYEIFMLSIPLLAALVIFLAVRRFKSGEGRIRFVINLFSILLLLLSGHNLALGIGYNTTPIGDRMGISEVKITKENLASAMISLRDEINELSLSISYSEDGVSRANLSFDEISEEISASYEKVSQQYDFAPAFRSKAKRVRLGNIMSYLGITGIYTFYTGEANVNSAHPEYDMTFTAAHELSHQRGIMRENEANFMAYILCSKSDNIYLRYSGALYIYEYIASALYRTDKDMYYCIAAGLSERARGDIKASSAITQKYSDTIFANISRRINDLFLKSNGTEGVVSYGMVVSLVVAYHEQNSN